MSLVLILGLLALFFTAAIGVPVAFAIIIGVITYLGFAGQDIAIAGETIVQRLYDGFLLLAVPLFIVSANIMNAGTISDRLLKFCISLVGGLRGGWPCKRCSLIFSGMSGSAVADAAGVGKIIIEMMVKSGLYTRGYAAAITAATATIGPIIPPYRWCFMHWCLIHQLPVYFWVVSSRHLMGAVLMGMNAWISHKRQFGQQSRVNFTELPLVTLRATPALLMPVILLFGIYSGVTANRSSCHCFLLCSFLFCFTARCSSVLYMKYLWRALGQPPQWGW